MKKNLILMSALFAGSMIVNSGFGANLEVNINNVNELTTRNRLSTLNVNDLIELAGDVKQLSSPRYANHDLVSPEMISDALNRILIEIRNKKGHLYLDQNRNLDTLLYAYQDNRDAWDLITSDRMDDKKYAFSSLDNTIKYFQCYSQLDNTIKSDLIKHLIRERDKATIDYWANIKLSYQVSIENLIQKLVRIADSIKRNLDDAYSDEEISSMHDKIFAIPADINFKFEDCKHLTNFIDKYRNYRGLINLMTPERLSNIDTNDLLAIVIDIAEENDIFHHLENYTKKLTLNKIFTALTDRNFKFESCGMLEHFISAYYDNTKAMDLITPDRLSNINTEDLLCAERYLVLLFGDDEFEEPPYAEIFFNKIFAALSDRDFKFESFNDLVNFISTYYGNTKAMDLITSDKLSNIPNEQLESIVKWLNKCLPYANPSKKENIQRVIDIIDQKLHQISLL